MCFIYHHTLGVIYIYIFSLNRGVIYINEKFFADQKKKK